MISWEQEVSHWGFLAGSGPAAGYFLSLYGQRKQLKKRPHCRVQTVLAENSRWIHPTEVARKWEGKSKAPNSNADCRCRSKSIIGLPKAVSYAFRKGGVWLYPIAGSFERYRRMKSISVRVISSLVAVSDSHRMSRVMVKLRLCSGVKSCAMRSLDALPK